MCIRDSIDGERFDDLDGFYEEVSRGLMGEEFWGRNLDAFNDILSGGMGRVPGDGRFTLRWRNHARSQRQLGHPETARHLEAMLSWAHPSNHPDIRRRLAAAKRAEGSTLFDR